MDFFNNHEEYAFQDGDVYTEKYKMIGNTMVLPKERVLIDLFPLEYVYLKWRKEGFTYSIIKDRGMVYDIEDEGEISEYEYMKRKHGRMYLGRLIKRYIKKPID